MKKQVIVTNKSPLGAYLLGTLCAMNQRTGGPAIVAFSITGDGKGLMCTVNDDLSAPGDNFPETSFAPMDQALGLIEEEELDDFLRAMLVHTLKKGDMSPGTVVIDRTNKGEQA